MTSISVGGVILCKQSISTFQYFKFVIGVIKREKIDIVHFHFGSYLIAPFLRILFPRIRIISTRHSEIFVSNKLKKLYLKFCFFPFEKFWGRQSGKDFSNFLQRVKSYTWESGKKRLSTQI